MKPMRREKEQKKSKRFRRNQINKKKHWKNVEEKQMWKRKRKMIKSQMHKNYRSFFYLQKEDKRCSQSY